MLPDRDYQETTRSFDELTAPEKRSPRLRPKRPDVGASPLSGCSGCASNQATGFPLFPDLRNSFFHGRLGACYPRAWLALVSWRLGCPVHRDGRDLHERDA